MLNKKYTVICEGKEVEVTEDVYKLCVTEPECERRLSRKKKFGRIDIDLKNENVSFILCVYADGRTAPARTKTAPALPYNRIAAAHNRSMRACS